MSEELKKFLSYFLIFIGLLLLAISLIYLPVRANVKSPVVEITREITIHIGEPQLTQSEPARSIDIYPLEIIQRNKNIDLVARLIEAEAGLGSIPFGEKVCVGLTVLHRVDDPAFPNNVQANVYKGSEYTVPSKIASETSIKAAKRAFELWESGESYDYLPSEALYFKGDGKNNHFHDRDGNQYEDLDILSQENPDDEILEILPEDDILSDDTMEISISDEIVIKEDPGKDILEL